MTSSGWVARISVLVLALVGEGFSQAANQGRTSEAPPPHVVVVGAGIAGLSAALELGRGGASVAVIDMASVYGGHAVMAQGLLCIVGTPYQESHGVHDSPDLAYRDFVDWGEDPNPEWLRYYVDHSNEEIYRWLTDLGVSFIGLARPPGNRVNRGHQVRGRGIALVAPIYRECLQTEGITFRWNVRLDRLLRSGERVTGVVATYLRTGEQMEISASAVVLATGGFQSNLALVREAWPKNLPLPARVLAGGGVNAMGSGLEVAQASGAAIERLDHQWNYITGLPDPRFPGSQRGLHAVVPSIWVNAEGRRFMAEGASPKDGMPILLQQTDATYWAIFDREGATNLYVSGSDWGDFRKIEALVLNNPAIVKRADTLDALAGQTGLPADALRHTVERFNALVEKGTDDDFGRFGPGKRNPPPPVSTPPYFAAQFFPLARKSMGGVVIDLAGRVLDRERNVIPGLYAAGEVTGLAGINGKAGLEGTFLGPSLLTGRVAGRSALVELGRQPAPPPVSRTPIEFLSVRTGNDNQQCLACHAIPALVDQARPGFWHFEKLHRVVVEKQFACLDCHGEMIAPFVPNSSAHKIDRLRQLQTCATCHQGEAR